MGKYALITKLGLQDNGVTLPVDEYVQSAEVAVLANRNAKEIKLDKLFMEMKRLKLEPTELVMDLLIIACSMYTADTRIDRLKSADDSWTRRIDLFIPVSDVIRWNQQKDLLKRIFKFLTGDIWNISFRNRTDISEIAPKSKLKKFGMSYTTDTVCLLSGGMDSFIGAINLLSNNTQPLFLGHAKSSDVSPNQKFCESALKGAFPNLPFNRIYAFVRVPKKNLFDQEEKTERGRSFLFLSLGGMCASALASPSKLIVPENGLISLNLPLTPLRVGSHSTRTTHPYYMSLMQQLFNSLNMGVTIKNPYQFKTKGEMLAECAKSELVRETKTMSCSHPSGRFQSLGNGHCGYCVPCLIRQAAYKKANILENKDYRTNIFNSAELDTVTKKDNIASFRYLIKKLEQKPNYLTSIIRVTGPLGEEVADYIDTYKRGVDEVKTLLEQVSG